VAWADGELSPGEATQVEAHVRTCATCARHDAALRGVTPRPRLVRPPPEVMRRLDRALDVDVLLARAAREPAPEALAVRMQRFLRHETSVPRAGVLAYAALLLFAVSVAAVGWWGGRARADGGRRAVHAALGAVRARFVPAFGRPCARAGRRGGGRRRLPLTLRGWSPSTAWTILRTGVRRSP
jgi:anti-sigma factor RsiW